MTALQKFRFILGLSFVVSLAAGCSGGSSEPSSADSAAAQSNFSRPLTDAEKAKAGAAAAPSVPDKKPIGG